METTNFWFDKSDPDYLIVPYEGNSDFVPISVFQSRPATIPCKPSDSKATVSLWKIHTNSGEPEQIVVDPNLGVTYNPKKGFHFENPRWDTETSLLECRVKLDDIEHVSKINIHWSSELFIFSQIYLISSRLKSCLAFRSSNCYKVSKLSISNSLRIIEIYFISCYSSFYLR